MVPVAHPRPKIPESPPPLPQMETYNFFTKVVLHEMMSNNDFYHDRVEHHCCIIVLNGLSMVPTLQSSVALNIVAANPPV